MLIGLLEELEIDYLDLLPFFLERPQEILYNMTPAGHLSINGHKAATQILSDFLAGKAHY